MTEALRRTPCDALHRRLGGRMVPFAGWAMPVQYSSILEEHAAVRERAGLFDVSHMGQIHLEGPAAVATAERLLTCPVEDLRPGRVRYGMLCNERGGVVDDVTVYRLAPDRLFLCVNAANVARDRDWIGAHAPAGLDVDDRSDATGLLALQGPASPAVLAGLADADVAGLRRFRFCEAKVAGRPALVSRTGYTGSDGYELYVDAADAADLFEALLEAGAPGGVRPAGLGARDTLRLEAALPLHGHELDEDTTPLEARLGRFVKLERGGFVGAEALARQAAEGPRRVLVGFELTGRGVARAGHPLAREGRELGRVTSGGHSPTLRKSIGLGYVPPSSGSVGARVDVVIRNRAVAARIVETPFVAPPRR